MKKVHLSALALIGMASIVSLSACQDEDFGYTAEQIAYRTNFEKTFKDYRNVETWDFSTYNLNKMGLEGGPSFNGQTRATGNSTTPITGRWFNVPEGVSDWLDENLKEGIDNRKKGTLDFVLRMPDDHDILIIPIYQGQAGLVWNLGIKDEATGSTEIIWEKSHGIQTSRGDMNYTNETVGSTTNYSPQSSDFIEKNEAGGNDNHKCLSLGSAIPSDFNPSSDWLKVTITDMGITNGGSSGVFCVTDSKNNNVQSDQTWVQVNNNKGSISFDIKNEDMLRAIAQNNTDFRFAMYWSEPDFISNNNSEIKVSIQRYKKEKGEETWQDMKDNDGNYLTDYNSGHTINQKIRSQALRVDHTKFSGYFSLYLDLQNLDNTYNGSNTFREHYASREIQSSTQSMMVALTEIKDNDTFSKAVLDELKDSFYSNTKNIMFLGCEDSDIPRSDGVPGSDWDMNDVVFLIVGLSSENVRPSYEEMIRKRYMIEDLGGTFDFDFNDIVIDLEQVTDLHTGVKTQKMSLKHLCGTIPWRVQIGEGSNKFVSTKLPGRNNDCETGGDGYDPTSDMTTYGSVINVTLPDNPWNPDENNIIFTSWPSAAGWDDTNNTQSDYLAEANGRTYTFTEGGEIPYIIACDPSIEWQKEGITIPNNWYSIWKREIAKTANKLALQQSIVYVIQSSTDEERQRTVEYSTNSPAQVMITCESANGTAPICTHDQANQTFTFDGTNATPGVYTYTISQASTTYFEGKSLTLKVRVLYEALQISNLTVTPDVITIEAGQSSVISYTTSGTGNISVDPAENVTTSVDPSNKQISINVSDDATPGSMIILHVRQEEDNTYYDADKAVTVKVRGAITSLNPGNVEVYTSPMDITWDGNGNSSNKKGLFFGSKDDNAFNKVNFNLSDHVGEQLIVKVSSDDYDNALYALRNQGWGNYQDDAQLPGDFAITITKDMVDNGLLITGKGYTIESVTLNCPGHADPKGNAITATHIAEGSTTLYNNGDYVVDNWSGYITITKDKFKNASEGDVIIVHVKDIYENSKIGARQNTSGWPQLADGYEAANLTGDFEIPITESILATLQANDLVINGCYFTITKVTLRTAPAVPCTFTATIADGCSGMGTISVTPQKDSYVVGDEVTVNAQPNDGYKFISWSDGGAQSHTIKLTGDKSITANFAALATYTISVSVEGEGTVSGGGTYTENSKATLTATAPSDGKSYKIIWKKNGDVISGASGSSLVVDVTGSDSYSVEFVESQEVTLSAETLSNKEWKLSDYITPGDNYSIIVNVSNGVYVQIFNGDSDQPGAYFSGSYTFKINNAVQSLYIKSGTESITSITITKH